jgi:hypothetical protein
MKSMDERTEIIRKLIKQRVMNRLFVGDISLYEVNSLPFIMVWGTPEGTTFNIFQTYFVDSKRGKSEIQIIKELEESDEDGVPNSSTLPNNINAYIRLRLRREFPMIAHLYTDAILLSYKNVIAEDMGHNQNITSKQSNPATNKGYSSVSNKSTGGCYIATACYGSYDAPEVIVLRKFRDDTLIRFKSGRLFIKIYYKFSPIFVRITMHNKLVNESIRQFLDRFVLHLSKKNSTNKNKFEEI